MIELDWHPDEKALARFGRLAPLGMGILGGLTFWRTGGNWLFPSVLWGIGTLAFVLSFLAPEKLRQLFLLAQGIGWLVVSAVGYTVMTFLFFCVFTPIGLFFRLIRRDSLKRDPNPAVESYWRPGRATRPSKYYYHQS